MYLLAILLPPVAVLMTGRPIQAALNFILTLCFWIPGAIHAVLVVNENKADKRMERQVKLQRELDMKDYEKQRKQQEREDKKEWKREGI